MGYSRFDYDAYTDYSHSVKSATRGEVFTSKKVVDEFKPQAIQFRESRDSELNPCAMPILVGLDVTGSMGFIAEEMAKNGLGPLMDGIVQRNVVADPHLLFMAIGDAFWDRSPLQATQFEADNRIVDQLTKLYLEGGGGGNRFESYDLAWLFAAHRTQTDAWDKRQKKGFVFTIGDELFPEKSKTEYAKDILGHDCPQHVDPASLYNEACERYNVFHVVVEEGNFCRNRAATVISNWQRYLGKRVLPLNNHKHVSEVIISAIAVEEGRDVFDVIDDWPADIKETVKHALLYNNQG